MTHLTTVPTFVFANGDELPIQVSFYNGSIELSQVEFGADRKRTITLSPQKVTALLNQIRRHQKEAAAVMDTDEVTIVKGYGEMPTLFPT